MWWAAGVREEMEALPGALGVGEGRRPRNRFWCETISIQFRSGKRG